MQPLSGWQGAAGEAVAEGLYRRAIEAGKSSEDPHDPRDCAALHSVGYFLKEQVRPAPPCGDDLWR